ncbi:MAG: hypothetical protein ACYCSN_20655, partial [Acidobacteriaceae bacterium]
RAVVRRTTEFRMELYFSTALLVARQIKDLPPFQDRTLFCVNTDRQAIATTKNIFFNCMCFHWEACRLFHSPPR